MVLKDITYEIRGYTVYNATVNSVLDYSDISDYNNLMCLCRMIYSECNHLLMLAGKDISIIARKNKVCVIIISYSDMYHEKEITLKCEKTAQHELTIKKVVYLKTTNQYTEITMGVKYIWKEYIKVKYHVR